MIAWPGLSHAQVFTWQTGPIDPTDYNDSTNWTPAGGAPSFPGQSALFGAGGSPNVVVNTAVAPDSWTFNAASQNYIIFGDTVTFSRPASAGGGIVNLANNGASLIVANDLNGVGGVLQNGNSTLMLFGAANSFTGATVVLAGTLAAGNVNAFSFQSAHFVNAGATLRIDNNVFTDIASLSDGPAGGGVVLLNGVATLLRINGSTTGATFSGLITGQGNLEFSDVGSQTLTCVGSSIGGSLIVCGCATGVIEFRGGTFQVGAVTSVMAGTLLVSNGGTLTSLG